MTVFKKCSWALKSSIEEHYHDEEWGVPVHDDRMLFEFLILEGAQAGLSWRTILTKRDAYRRAFKNFEPECVAAFEDVHYQQLLQNTGIVRNPLKLRSVISNAKAFLDVKQEFGSFDRYIWDFVGGRTVHNHVTNETDVPSSSPVSKQMSLSLRKRGFKFVGPVICYAFMQATGMVNDHAVDCFRYQQLLSL